MHIRGRILSLLLAVILAGMFLFYFGLTPGQAADCPCFGGVDNFCFYPASTAGCPMTYPGGYCDPNGDGDYTDGDWVRGFFEYQDTCPNGGPPPPPPPGDDDGDDDDNSDYSSWIYGIHWHGDNYAGTDVESMTGGKKIWVLETATTYMGRLDHHRPASKVSSHCRSGTHADHSHPASLGLVNSGTRTGKGPISGRRRGCCPAGPKCVSHLADRQ